MPRLRRLLAAVALGAFGVAARAAQLTDVDVVGLDEEMTTNVRIALSLQAAIGKRVSDARLEYLLRVAEDETREALHPFGYYSPEIRIQTVPAALEDIAEDAPVSVRIAVAAGEPVRVRSAIVAIEGDGADDRYLRQELDRFAPKIGDVLDHRVYERSKAFITRRLAERGYFDADFASRRVEVTRAERAAEIDLRWDSGDRYEMGEVTFVQSASTQNVSGEGAFDQGERPAIRESLLREFVYWEEGEYYHQGRLDRLRKSLAGLDYFSRIDIEPRPEDAIDGRVPVTVRLTPAPRSVYSVGASFGTDSGFGVSLGLERRYLNSRGHKLLAQLDYAEKRKVFTVQHRIPAFAWRDGWYTSSLQAYDEQTDYIDTRRYEAVFSRSGQYNRNLNLIASVHALSERWAYDYETVLRPVTLYRQATYVYPSIVAEYVQTDDRIQPRAGFGGSATLRGGIGGLGSDASFLQAHVRGAWFRGLGPRSRLIARGEVGATFTDDLVEIPPTLRFYAGGDRSVRGYQYREIGPRIAAGPRRDAFALGAKNVVAASLEFERYFSDAWGAAVFVDGGSAFDDRLDRWRQGVGVGLRWKSPVGPLRIDLAHGLDDPDASFTLHINLGADL